MGLRVGSGSIQGAKTWLDLKQEITLGEGQDAGGLAGDDCAVHAHFVGFGIDFEVRRGVVVNHVLLADAPAVAHGRDRPQAEPLWDAGLRDASDTKVMLVAAIAAPKLPNIGRYSTGCGVGMEALGSPIALQAMNPPFTIISGFTPKNAGFQSTRSASLPGSIEPISAAMPWVIAGLMVYFAT